MGGRSASAPLARDSCETPMESLRHQRVRELLKREINEIIRREIPHPPRVRRRRR